MAAARRKRDRSITPPPPSSRAKRQRADHDPNHADSSEEMDLNWLRLYSWNVNGVHPFLQRPITSFFKPESTALAERDRPIANETLRDVLRRYGWPSMFYLQEVKINPKDLATQKAVERAVAPDKDEPPDSPRYRVFFCLPTDLYNAKGSGRKLYGVCSIIRQDFLDTFVETIREVEWDTEGRFLVCETKAVGSVPRLAIFNIYAVNGTDLPYKDSDTGKIVGTRHDRKLQVHKLLQAECRILESRGISVILAGDLNVARAPIDGHPNLRTVPKQHCFNRADFETRFCRRVEGGGIETSDRTGAIDDVDLGLEMIDTFRHLHPHRLGYTYYPRYGAFGASCDRVDMILISRSLEDRLLQAGIHETPKDRGSSDHVPLYVCMSLAGTCTGKPKT